MAKEETNSLRSWLKQCAPTFAKSNPEIAREIASLAENQDFFKDVENLAKNNENTLGTFLNNYATILFHAENQKWIGAKSNQALSVTASITIKAMREKFVKDTVGNILGRMADYLEDARINYEEVMDPLLSEKGLQKIVSATLKEVNASTRKNYVQQASTEAEVVKAFGAAVKKEIFRNRENTRATRFNDILEAALSGGSSQKTIEQSKPIQESRLGSTPTTPSSKTLLPAAKMEQKNSLTLIKEALARLINRLLGTMKSQGKQSEADMLGNHLRSNEKVKGLLDRNTIKYEKSVESKRMEIPEAASKILRDTLEDPDISLMTAHYKTVALNALGSLPLQRSGQSFIAQTQERGTPLQTFTGNPQEPIWNGISLKDPVSSDSIGQSGPIKENKPQLNPLAQTKNPSMSNTNPSMQIAAGNSMWLPPAPKPVRPAPQPPTTAAPSMQSRPKAQTPNSKGNLPPKPPARTPHSATNINSKDSSTLPGVSGRSQTQNPAYSSVQNKTGQLQATNLVNSHRMAPAGQSQVSTSSPPQADRRQAPPTPPASAKPQHLLSGLPTKQSHQVGSMATSHRMAPAGQSQLPTSSPPQADRRQAPPTPPASAKPQHLLSGLPTKQSHQIGSMATAQQSTQSGGNPSHSAPNKGGQTTHAPATPPKPKPMLTEEGKAKATEIGRALQRNNISVNNMNSVDKESMAQNYHNSSQKRTGGQGGPSRS